MPEKGTDVLVRILLMRTRNKECTRVNRKARLLDECNGNNGDANVIGAFREAKGL